MQQKIRALILTATVSYYENIWFQLLEKWKQVFSLNAELVC